MKKYIEFGFGNTWLVRTEFEDSNGYEWEEKGISGTLAIRSIYLRIWLFTKVLVLDTQTGLSLSTKQRNNFKFIIGICSDV